ncbi:MAG: hypothetical protein AAF968_24185 [Pseudomonadota bacterium]
MTEMTATTARAVSGPWLRDTGPRRTRRAPPPAPAPIARPAEPYGPRVNVAAFLLSTACTPLVIGVLGIPLIIPPFAAVIGLPVYLTVGVAGFWMLARQLHRQGAPLRPWRFARVGFLTNLFAPIVYALLVGLNSPVFAARNADVLYTFWALGAVFSPVFGLVFGATYRSLARAFAARTPSSTSPQKGD